MPDTDVMHNLVLLKKLVAQKPGMIIPGGPISRTDLEAYLKESGVSDIVPGQYKEWLLHVNGLRLLWTELYGIGSGGVINNAFDKYKTIKKYHKKYFPIGHDGGGNDYVVDLLRLEASGDGPVLFADGSDDWAPSYIVASGIHHYIRFVLLLNAEAEHDIRWPFDSGFMLREDPAIARLGYPLPWEV